MEATSVARVSRPIISPSIPSHWNRPRLLSAFPSSRISRPPLSVSKSISLRSSIGSEKNRTFVVRSSASSEGEPEEELPIEKRYPAFPAVFDIFKILDTLPHRYPFLYVDRVIEYNPGVSAVAIKNVTINDNFFPGHLPERPIMPGVLIIESPLVAHVLCTPFFFRGEEISPGSFVGHATGIDDLKTKKLDLFVWRRDMAAGFLIGRGHMIRLFILTDEAMAQVAGILLTQPQEGPSRTVFPFAALDKARFRKPVMAGDTLVIRMTLVKQQKPFNKLEGKAYVGGQVACEGEFLLGTWQLD
ncbi:hypothetical protein ACLOJK_016190 [Asimina triloba]